jgi:hypothetical protein
MAKAPSDYNERNDIFAATTLCETYMTTVTVVAWVTMAETVVQASRQAFPTIAE